ncbi:GAF domain-containing protein [Lutimonas saemankumensis]|uniref:GAF domain-containing protein n=1 Tax=Lutimonas saemankumensis TaxID=483016 RepID=UPI001CD75A21|nr:GAF domain-containing protein [Lutimonas saemankumensis]MCA0930945.1 GAF domain-containing protein [Lutimonas saemankumensis]
MTLREKITEIIGNNLAVEEKLKEICLLLQKSFDHFHWVGFYFINGSKEELKLSEFAGKPTEHTHIPFGKGICGQVALSNKNFVVQDVQEQENYISCGIEVKSEIVVPIFQEGRNIGQIDIDSHDLSPFSEEDERILEYVCNEVARLDLDHMINPDPS